MVLKGLGLQCSDHKQEVTAFKFGYKHLMIVLWVSGRWSGFVLEVLWHFMAIYFFPLAQWYDLK